MRSGDRQPTDAALNSMLVRSEATAGFVGMFTCLMIVAAGWDVRQRRIPNALVIATLTLGVAFAFVTWGVARGGAVAAEGVAVGLALWLPWWWFGMMGAGDVKFFAAAAAWLGPRGALNAAIVAALLGGLLGIGWVVARKRLGRNAGSAETIAADEGSDDRRTAVTLPYGVAMALGLGVAAWIPLIR